MYYDENSYVEFLWAGGVLWSTLSVLRGWLVWPYLKVSRLLIIIFICTYGIKFNGLVGGRVGKVHVLC